MYKNRQSVIYIKDHQAGYGSISALGKQLARAHPVVNVASGFGELADKLFMQPEHALLNFSRRVASCRLAQQRSSWIGGRLYNRFSGEDPNYVTLSGTVIAIALDHVGDTHIAEAVDRRFDYDLRLDVASDLLERFQRTSRLTGMIK